MKFAAGTNRRRSPVLCARRSLWKNSALCCRKTIQQHKHRHSSIRAPSQISHQKSVVAELTIISVFWSVPIRTRGHSFNSVRHLEVTGSPCTVKVGVSLRHLFSTFFTLLHIFEGRLAGLAFSHCDYCDSAGIGKHIATSSPSIRDIRLFIWSCNHLASNDAITGTR